ncbi:hypothetical protein ACFU96_20990 [Streptomyces sp. NPDC057620]|uniref:hypothetical protein n=1 Tax=Streptomyces sp. NPDC057620 TaxID=3346185 RepID=UPI0036B65ADF
MPDDSRVRSAPLGGWTKITELLALVVEEIGLLAADRRREEPTTVVRPSRPGPVPRATPGMPPGPSQAAAEEQAPRTSGHRQMLAAAMQRGMIRSG